MSISIIIAAYNAERYLAETLESVLVQTVTDWRLIVVDDGSSDTTPEIVARFAERDSRIRLVRQDNAGVAAARNRGFADSDSSKEFVTVLDHDDVWRPEALELLLAALRDKPDTVAVHGLARKVDADGRPMGEGTAAIQNYDRRIMVGGKNIVADRSEPTTTAMVITDNWIPTPGVALVRRSAMQALHDTDGFVFDRAAVPLDDWDLWLRLSLLGGFAFVDGVVLDWRRHDAAGSVNTGAMSDAELRLRTKMLTMPGLGVQDRAAASACYHRLLATRQRRASHDQWRAAKTDIAHGRILSALTNAGTGGLSYLRYLQLRRLEDRVACP